MEDRAIVPNNVDTIAGASPDIIQVFRDRDLIADIMPLSAVVVQYCTVAADRVYVI
jgi:hypothetical protein